MLLVFVILPHNVVHNFPYLCLAFFSNLTYIKHLLDQLYTINLNFYLDLDLDQFSTILILSFLINIC